MVTKVVINGQSLCVMLNGFGQCVIWSVVVNVRGCVLCLYACLIGVCAGICSSCSYLIF